MRKIIYTLLITLTISSCETMILGGDTLNNPVNNFEIFWNDINEHYSLFGVRGHDWDSIYQVYRPQVNMNTSDEDLWEIFKFMITYLDDSHVMILQPKEDFNKDIHYFESGGEENKQVEKEFSLDLVKTTYLESATRLDASDEDLIQLYGKVKDRQIGYIYLNGIEASENDFMDQILANIGQYEAIIFDLRNNMGGEDPLATEIAGRFATSEQLIYTVEEKNGSLPTDFGAPISYYSKRKGSAFYDKPLIVLTDKITVSAAEILLLHLNSFTQVTQIGDVTAGDFSDTSMRRFLPNGWQYQYSIFKFLLPDGRSLDGVGHLPDIQIRNTEASIQSGNDMVMEKAFEYLEGTYQIR